MKKIIILCFMCLNLWAGGNEVGNGGDVVICTSEDDQEKKTLKMLDYYEKTDSDFTIEEQSLDDEYQIVKKVLKKLVKLSPSLYEKYMRDLKEFRLKVKFKKNENLRDIKDSKHVSLKKKCKLFQVAYQRKHPLTKKTEVFINKDLYEQMDALQRAMLLTHEIIYEHFIYFGHQNSVKTRLFNRYLHSKEIKEHKRSDFIKLGEQLGVPLY